jgi:hypothetical protein
VEKCSERDCTTSPNPNPHQAAGSSPGHVKQQRDVRAKAHGCSEQHEALIAPNLGTRVCGMCMHGDGHTFLHGAGCTPLTPRWGRAGTAPTPQPQPHSLKTILDWHKNPTQSSRQGHKPRPLVWQPGSGQLSRRVLLPAPSCCLRFQESARAADFSNAQPAIGQSVVHESSVAARSSCFLPVTVRRRALDNH